MKQIPTEVMEKIETYIQDQKHLVSSEGLENIRTDILFGYHLLFEGKEKEIAELQQEFKANYFLTESLYKEIAELKAENERMKNELDQIFDEHKP